MVAGGLAGGFEVWAAAGSIRAASAALHNTMRVLMVMISPLSLLNLQPWGRSVGLNTGVGGLLRWGGSVWGLGRWEGNGYWAQTTSERTGSGGNGCCGDFSPTTIWWI